jgi:predicted ATPase/DNA-binding winged helix-turn-helix (wHTH) protein
MDASQLVFFPPFRLDVQNEQLWKDGQPITIRPKTLAVLRHLVENPGRLITKKELLDTIWVNTRVSEALPKDYIQELRKILNDDPQSPRFIETVHGRGYRFIAPLTTAPPVVSSQYSVVSKKEADGGRARVPTQHSVLVGRETELQQLHDWSAAAMRGQRTIVFVTGEPGIGKTTLVEEFLRQAAAQNEIRIARGQCLEQYGAGEAYMPMLEAVTGLCREPDNEHIIALLRRHAPTWLVQLPNLVNPEDLSLLQRNVQGATRERMLREMGEAIEALTADHPLILTLEDLHWSDSATLALLTIVAQRTPPARLLVIGTYRPTDARDKNHPLTALTHELRMRKQCQELPLRFLQESAVAAYLAARFPENRFPTVLSRTIHRRTEGNPLFMINMTDYLTDQGLIVQYQEEWVLQARAPAIESGIPTSLHQIIEQQFEDQDPHDRQLLEVASVAGMEFAAAAVASGLGEEEELIEERCAALARRGCFVRFQDHHEWPDGSITGRYNFIHALYQEVLYGRITPSRRMRLHRRIGEREEIGHGDHCEEIASELAAHFERGRDYERTVRYLHLASKNALQRCAYQEAISHCTKALALLKFWSDAPERTRQELTLQIALGAPLIATKGYGSPEVEGAYARARELCQQLGETLQLFPVLWGLWVMYFVRGDLQLAQDLARQLLELSRRAQDPALLLEAHVASGLTQICLGQFAAALDHLQGGIELYDPQQHGDHAFVYGQDPGVVCLSWAAWALWFLGYPTKSLEKSREAIALARRLNYPFSLAYALGCAAVFHQLRREGAPTHAHAEEAITLSDEQGFTLWSAAGHILKGWALVDEGQPEEGITQLYQGLAAWQETGAGFLRSYGFALLPEAYRKTGRIDEGLAAVDGAFAVIDHNGERLWEAELYRLKGELLLQQSRP